MKLADDFYPAVYIIKMFSYLPLLVTAVDEEIEEITIVMHASYSTHLETPSKYFWV